MADTIQMRLALFGKALRALANPLGWRALYHRRILAEVDRRCALYVELDRAHMAAMKASVDAVVAAIDGRGGGLQDAALDVRMHMNQFDCIAARLKRELAIDPGGKHERR